MGVLGGGGVEVDVPLCANPSAAANTVSAMVFMIPLSFYLLGSQRQLLPNGVAVTIFFMPSTTVPSGELSSA